MKNSRTQGFTLVETMVAIAILTMAISGAYTAVQTGLSSSVFTRDEVIAYNLASEEVEMVRNIRDENGLKGQFWLTGLTANSSDPCYFGQYCVADAIANSVTNCGIGHSQCPDVRLDPDNGFYGYNASWGLTPFKRSISINQVATDANGNISEIGIIVTVTWTKNGSNRVFRVRENLMNWQ